MPDQPQIVTLLIHCRNLPGTQCGERRSVRLGIQEDKDVVYDVPADTESVTFTAPLRIRRKTDGAVDFGGPYVQGPTGQRFIYLCWGERLAAGGWDGFRRAKLLLQSLTWQAVERSLRTDTPLEVQISMTDAKGLPICASLRSDAVEWRV